MILDDPKRIPAIPRFRNAAGDQLYMAKSKEYLLEMMPKDVSKTEGINSFAQSLEIRREEAMACGDNTQRYRNAGMGGAGRGQRGAGAEKQGRIMCRKRGGLSRGGSGKEICSGVKS